MNLGLMAMAANAGMEADRRQKVFDHEQKKRESELSLLDDRVDAERSGYRLRAGQNQQGLDLLPGDTETKKTNQKTAGINASMGLANAENEQTNLPASLQIKNNTLQGQLMTSNADLEHLPQKLQQAAVQGVLTQQGQADVVLGTLGQLISRNDKDAAIRFANQVAQMPNVLPNTNGKPLADIKGVRKGEVIGKDQNGNDIPAQGDGYLFITNDGQAHFNPVTTLQAAMGKLQSGEFQFIHTSDGSVYSGNKQTGAVTQTHQGNPKINALGDRRPREIQLFEFYKGLGYKQDDALAKVKELGHKSRQQFEADALKDAFTSAMGRTPEEKAANAYAMVKKAADLVYGTAQGPTAPASNWSEWATPAPQASATDRARAALGLSGAPAATPRPAPSSSIDPKIRELLGIPGQ